MKRLGLRMQIELTNFCNFKCVYCPHSVYGEDAGPSGNPFDRPKGYMSPELWKKSLAAATSHAQSVTMGFFGEQQLHKEFRRFILSVPPRSERKFALILNTNWSLVTSETVDVLRRFDAIRISIDSSDPHKWEKLCPGGAVFNPDGTKDTRMGQRFAALAAKIKWWMKIPNRPATNLIFVTQEENEAEAKAFANEWRHILGRGDKVITKSILTYGGVMLDPYMQDNHCKVASENRFTVAWDGRCTPCNLDVNLAMAVLNLNTHTVEEILASPAWAATLAGIRAKQGICANCFDAQNHSQSVYGRSGEVKKQRTIPGKGKSV